MQSLKFAKLLYSYTEKQANGLNDFIKHSLNKSPAYVEPPNIVGYTNSSSPTPLAKPKSQLKKDTAASRVTTELEAAVALYKAGVPCKVRKAVVCAVKGWSRPTLYRRIAALKFPRPFKDGRSSWWWIADVLDDP